MKRTGYRPAVPVRALNRRRFLPRHYLGAVPATIRGGTSEVQRNVIATRGLELARG